MALGRRQPRAGGRQHAARGSQDACHASQQWLAAHGLRCRLSEQGEGLDNAVAERCCGSCKRARMALRPSATRQEARADGVDDIEMFSNSTRFHSSLGSVP